MVNYNNGKIYKIWSVQTDDIYVGSTTQSLATRLGKHKYNYLRYNQTQKGSCVTSFKILDCGDAKIELIEKFKCSSREELMAREGYYIRKLNCVNKHIMGRTGKQYYEDNREKLIQQSRQYYEDNKEKRKQYGKNYYEANKGNIKERRMQHYEDNKDKIRQWYKDNKGNIKQYKKQYRADNKEMIAQRKKQYYKDNKERLREKIKCECGSTIARQYLTRHKKSKKHLKFIADSP